jgi:hypothetical protein
MVLSRFSKKGQQTEGAEKGNETSSYCINTWRCGIQKHQKRKKRTNKTLTVQMQLWRRSTKKEIDRRGFLSSGPREKQH